MSESDAKAAARARMGDLERVRRECGERARLERRAHRRREWRAEILQDLKYGIRTLLRTPTFTSMSLITLAVGIGATTAIFSLIHAVLLAPLLYADPDRLVRLWERSPQGNERNVSHAFWQNRYGGDPGVLGRPIELNDVPYSVVGVMPTDFDFPGAEVDLWLPLTDDALDPMAGAILILVVFAPMLMLLKTRGARRRGTQPAEAISAPCFGRPPQRRSLSRSPS
ncbi:MAG: hypothetical protein WD995_11405 [Gemmatimonadota bacterium]